MTKYYVLMPYINTSDLTDKEFRVLFVLCSCNKWEFHENGIIEPTPGSCFPTRKTIADRAYCSTATVNRCLKRLEELGYIRRTVRYGEKGEQRSNGYTLIPNPE